MSYQVNNPSETKSITKGPGFTIGLPKAVSDDFSVAYVSLNNARDPAEKDLCIELNPGFSAFYLVTQGLFTFNFHENG